MSAQSEPKTTEVPKSLKERQREERARLILQAAEQVLAEKGYLDTSMDEIASRVGIAKGTIYLHYPSKDDLVIALFASELGAFRAAIAEIVVRPETARARLEALLLYSYRDVGSQRHRMFASLFETMNVPHSFFKQQESVKFIFRDIAEDIGMVLLQGQANGEFTPDLPMPIMRRMFLGLLSPRSYASLLDDEHLAPAEFARLLGRMFFGGIVKQ